MKPELQNLIQECTEELNDISSKISKLPPFDKEKIYLTNYALIKACGTGEYVYRSIVADFFNQSPLRQIHTYIDKTVRSGSMSVTYDNMSKLLGSFDDNWQKTFMNLVKARGDKQKLIDSAKSLVNNRHSFAHGKAPTASFNDIFQYYKDILELIYMLDAVVK